MGKRATGPDVEPVVTEFARRVRVAFQADRVIFFGSRVRGDHLKQSDYDFIIVSDAFEGLPFDRRIALTYQLWDSPMPVEPLCYTREEFERKRSQVSIVREAVREGVEV
ncbi:MAG: nucleotidyltransferase domain-containing protein [Chloroflexota bacterium]